MDVLTRSDTPSLYWPGVRNIFGMGYREAEQVCRKIVATRKSTQAEEKMVEMVGLGLVPPKGEVEPYKMDRMSEGMEIYVKHVGYSLGVAISHEAEKDNLYAKQVTSASRALLRSSRQTIEIIAHAPLNKGFDPAVQLGNSGAPLLSDSHQTARAGLQSNVLAVPAALSELALETLITQMAIAKDQRTLQLNFQPKKLVIHPSNRWRSGRLLLSSLQPNTFSNNINVLKHVGAIPEVVISPYLQDEKAFHILTDCEEPAITMFEREGFQVEEYYDKRTKARETSVYFRLSALATEWRAIYSSQGA